MNKKPKTAVVTSLVGRGIEVLGKHFIGLWCFNVLGQDRKWCVTLNVGGHYFDTEPTDTTIAALHDARKTLDRAIAMVKTARTK